MSLESISFLTYFTGRLPAETPAADNALLLKQGDSVRQISFEALAEAFAAESGNGAPVTLPDGAVLSAIHGTVFGAPDEGVTVEFHLPVYGAVSPRKAYRLKNIGQGILRYDSVDGKLIDGELFIELAPGDRCLIAKDGDNWQTF
ncbi:MAG: hypothetical protein A2Y38_21455 [Spirochaetes bacterium GWB1_59_5]|nr:MAG: hypothetical protein A2Y38_21455 [Spirochaetes bacterium GWB1_59_5]